MADLSNLSLAQLRNLQEQVKSEIKSREAQEIQTAREQILAIAQGVGIPLDVLLGNGGKGSKTGVRNPVAVRYKHPENASQQWTGRGRQPKWVKEWVEGGQPLEKLLVA